MPDQPLLPQRTGGTRPPVAPATDALSLDEAIERYRVSMSTLRRRLRAGEVAGAFKVHGPKGDEWRIPEGALDAIGIQPIGSPPAEPARVAPGEDVAHALRLVADGLARLERAQGQLQAAEEDRGRAEREREDARVEAAALRARLEAAQERAERLESELAAARPRRRWWQR